MKLIIDIPKERLDSIKHFGIKQNEVSMLERALISGTPLDDVKAEIDEQYDRVHSYNIDVAQGLEMALEILNNIGKESEDKE